MWGRLGIIYKATNKLNGKVYIGKCISRKIYIRISEHYNFVFVKETDDK